MSSREKNLELMRVFVEELWNRRQVELADMLLSETAVTHQLTSSTGPIPTIARTRTDLKNEILQWSEGFPDLNWKIEQVVASDDLVVLRYVVQGTHRGTWYGIPPTQKRIEFRTVHTVRIAGDQIVEDWLLADWHSLLHQIGVAPSIAEIIAKAGTVSP